MYIMAFPPHVQVAIKMLPHLIETAKEGKRTSYQEIAEAIGSESRLFSRPLAFIRDDICRRHNLPPLTAIVENKGSDRPLNSFDPDKLSSLSKAEYEAHKQEMLERVYGYEKWDRALEGLQNLYCAV